MAKAFKVQVSKQHYYEQYDSNILKFVYYFYQIDLTKKLKPQKILEVGIGNKTYYNYLKQAGYDIVSCDFDKKLEPDYIADIRKLPFRKNSFDVVSAFEVLEHLPFEEIDVALKELYRVSKRYVIVAIPYLSANFEFTIRFPFIGKIFKKSFVDLFLRLPYRFQDIKFEKEHYWEIGTKSYPLKRIRQIIEKSGFKIIREVRPVFDTTIYFFILEK